MIAVRPYRETDYQKLVQLYKKKEIFGGEFSVYRDSQGALSAITSREPNAILVAEQEGEVVGTVSLIENERVAWLYRFCVSDAENMDEVSEALYRKAVAFLSKKGHKEVLVYSDPDNAKLNQRYAKLGFKKGDNYVCFWKEL